MLTKPQAGWSDFHLKGTSVYGLSYLDDIGIEWASFVDYDQKNSDEKKQRLVQRLERLGELIEEKRVNFGPNRFFT